MFASEVDVCCWQQEILHVPMRQEMFDVDVCYSEEVDVLVCSFGAECVFSCEAVSIGSCRCCMVRL